MARAVNVFATRSLSNNEHTRGAVVHAPPFATLTPLRRPRARRRFMNARLTLPAFVLALLLSGCAKEKIQKIRPALAVSPTALDFAKVKVGDVAEQTITLSSQSQ